MPKKTINLLLRSKILVALIAGVLFMLGILQVAQGFIETRDYRTQIIQAVKDQTGKEITIRGKVSVSLLPTPTLYLPGVELRDPVAKVPTPILTVEMLRINASFFSLFSHEPKISGISIQRPSLEIERVQDNAINWDWLNLRLLKLMAAGNNEPMDVNVSEGKIIYHNNQTDQEIDVDNISAHGAFGGHSQINGSFNALGYNLQFLLTSGSATPTTSADDLPLSIKIYTNDKNMVQLQGNINSASDVPKVNATLNLETDNVLSWLQAKQADINNIFEQSAQDPSIAEAFKTPLPLKISASWLQDGWNIKLSDIKLDGLESSATGDISFSWVSQVAISANTDFSVMQYDRWKALVLLANQQTTGKSSGAGTGSDDQLENPLPQELQLALNLKAQKIMVGGQEWKDAQLSASLENASILINQFTIGLPGDSTLSLFGLISPGSTTKGLRFEGSMEAQGKSLRNTLTILDASAAELPETGLGNFSARSNLYISSEQMRISEADVKISDLHLNGGLVAYFDENPRLEADVRLKDINFDYFRDAWREKQKQVDQHAQFLTFDKNMKFSWLNKLKTTVDLKVNVDQFTFLERKGDSASFRLFAKEGQFGIYDLHFYYPNEVTEASLSVEMKDDQPFFNVLLNTNELNTDYFSITSDKKTADLSRPQRFVMAKDSNHTQIVTVIPQAQAIVETPPPLAQGPEDLKTPPVTAQPAIASTKPKWSEDLIDMSWMDGVNGAFDISVGNLIHKDTNIRDLKVRARLENNTLTVESLNFSYWQGRCEATGSLYGGKVPGLSIGFTLVDAELHDILKSAVGRENITGKANINGTFTTSGVNYLSWVSQAEAKLVLAARGVNVDGLNVQGVVDAVSVARTAADVFNNVNLALVNGVTQLSVDGNINVRNGSIKTPGITLKTGSITGNLTGEVKLLPWTINLSTFFQFPAMTSETVPTMTVQLAGPVEAPVLQTDTSSLEAYVAKRIVGR